MPSFLDDLPNEIAFREFITKLLSAQDYEFLDEHHLFSYGTLQQTMTKLCDIIADEVRAYSCTIQLKLYDPGRMLSPSPPSKAGSEGPIWEGDLLDYIERAREGWLIGKTGCGAADKEKEVLLNARWKSLASTLGYPYWKYPKGALNLVATNERSPWSDLCKSGRGFAPLDSGITADIVQDNYVKLRDPLRIRFSRNLRKLGGADREVWKNMNWWNSFKNFYGTPIQIHSKGEIIGVLKVENKLYPTIDPEKLLSGLNALSGFREIDDILGLTISDALTILDPKEVSSLVSQSAAVGKAEVGSAGEQPARNGPNEALTRFECDILRCYNKITGRDKTQSYNDQQRSQRSGSGNGLNLEDEKYRPISLLALAYLAEDLKPTPTPQAYQSDDLTPAPTSDGLRLQDFFFIEYPRGAFTGDYTKWDRLKACVDRSPVVQVVSGSLKDEETLCKILGGGKGNILDDYVRIRLFYKGIICRFKSLDFYKNYENLGNQQVFPRSFELEGVKVTALTAWCDRPETEEINDSSGVVLSHFYFKAKVAAESNVEGKESKEVTIYIFKPPAQSDCAEIDASFFTHETDARLEAERLVNVYKQLAGLKLNDEVDKEGSGYDELSQHGERILLRDSRHSHTVVDLLVDRWAARIQALNMCLPIMEFSLEDTHKLCWAALEIGKLVERQITYRANRSEDPIPLTAMEFFRIPISDLSFVDDLRKRRADAEQAESHIKHHIQTTLYTMHIQDAVQLKSRIKDFRSYLGRLGERHEGFVRGNLAIWFYLLYQTDALKPLEKTTEESGDRGEREGEAFRKFASALEEFGQGIDKLLEKHSKASGDLDPQLREFPQAFVKENLHKIIGDTRFVSPPFREGIDMTSERLECLKLRLVKNFVKEGVLVRRDPTDRSFDRKSPPKFEREDYEALIFRRYDPYAIAAASLWCQLENLTCMNACEEMAEEYFKFYDACFKLRNFLAVSAREIEDTPIKLKELADLFGRRKSSDEQVGKVETETAWTELLKFVQKYDTDAFVRFAGPSTVGKLLCLHPSGIYKRIRNLNHTLWQQRSPAHLEWELGRFDLLGFQLNCLYKNQVFAAYEQLWNRGDPFWGMNTEGPGRNSTQKFFDSRLTGPQRWLCMRTNYNEDDYYSLHIAGLVDPISIHEGFWEKSGYNLRRVQFLLGRLFDKIHPDGDCSTRYRCLARMRHQLRWEYVDWYASAGDLIRNKSSRPERYDRELPGFGSFLGEAAVDWIMDRIDEYRRAEKDANCTTTRKQCLQTMAVNAYRDLRPDLNEILRKGKVYTAKVLDALTTSGDEIKLIHIGGPDLPVVEIKERVASLYRNLKVLIKASNLPSADACSQAAEIECNRHIHKFQHKVQENGIVSETPNEIVSEIPVIFVSANEPDLIEIQPDATYEDIRSRLYDLYDVLASFRREQNGYLFYKGNCNVATATEKGSTQRTDKPGICLRDRDHVLHKIQNYVLLYDRESDGLSPEESKVLGIAKNSKSDPFLGWTSHDLFYYLRSLIPIEIQVRTALADTLAGQYHDSVYKGAPPIGTEFPRTQMGKIASDLDNLDKEMEIDFEDYISRYSLSKRKQK